MNRWDMIGEVLAGLSVFLLPIVMLYLGAALGLK